MRRIIWSGFVTSVLFLGAAATLAEGKKFDFTDAKGVNSVYFLLDSEVEPIMGLASETSGDVTFDPAAPDKISGSITVAAKSLHTQQPKMTEALHSAEWLDVSKYPEITFKFKSVKESKKSAENSFELIAIGDFTCKGVTKELTVPVRVTYLPEKLSARMGKVNGDLLIVRADFTITRADYNIKPGQMPQVVAPDIQIKASLAGACKK